MAMHYSVAGWLEVSPDQLRQLKQLISDNLDQNPHVDAWVFHESGGWTSFAFFGYTVRSSRIDRVEAQILRIASSIVEHDPDLPWPCHVDGCFTVRHEEEGMQGEQWVIAEGKFHRSTFPAADIADAIASG